MKDTIEIYVQPGKYGQHAGGRYPCRTYAAHKTDEATAAWRAALKHWFPSRNNGVLLYDEAKAITLDQFSPHEFRAVLNLPDDVAKKLNFARDFTPELPVETKSEPMKLMDAANRPKTGRKSAVKAKLSVRHRKPVKTARKK